MNWAKENKFLAGFFVVVVLGLGFLGFKALSADSKLEEANNAYAAKASEYNNLRRREPYPSNENLKKFEEQKAEAAERINAFQAELAKKEFPLNKDLQPTQFQDELKKSVNAIRAQAAEANVKLPEKFYLGFDRYETQPPDAAATPALGRQLKSIEWVLQQFIAARVAELRGLTRPELPEEKSRGGAGAAARRDDRPAGARPDRGGSAPRGGGGARTDLVASTYFDVIVLCKQPQFATVLSNLISPKAPQFFIPRAVRVKNQTEKGPARVIDAPPPAPEPAATTPAPGTPATPPADTPPPAAPAANVSYIVGQELIEASLRVEMVDFAEVAPAK